MIQLHLLVSFITSPLVFLLERKYDIFISIDNWVEKMPEFEVVSLNQAKIESASGRRLELVKEYLPYIEKLGEDQAGKLQPIKGEKVTTIKRRLNDAARLANKNIVVKRAGDQLYFWLETERAEPKRKRGRPRKVKQG